MICSLCPRKCSGLRERETGTGVCGQGMMPRVARAALHFWEEPCISGKNGSGAIFFSGCALRCVFCQNEEISHGGWGETITVERLREIMRELEAAGAETINLVTAGHFLSAVREALSGYRPGIPVVYNTSGYESAEAIRALDGLVDVYLPDMKTRSRRAAEFLFGAPDYPEVAAAAILEMVRQTGQPVYNENGIMTRGTLIRHLCLPSMTADSMQVLNWVYEHTACPVSLMSQYVPYGQAKNIKGLNRRLKPSEYQRVLDHMLALGLEGYTQEAGADDTAFIPAFDGTGVSAKE